MKPIFIFIFLFVFNCFGQNISEINKVLKLSDSLTFDREIRIYKDYSILNGIQVFRMYNNEKDDWKVQIYYYSKNIKECTKIETIEFSKDKVGNLNSKDANLIWLNLLLCDVEFLPDLKDVNYKLKKSTIESENGSYEIANEKTKVLDGVGYDVYIKTQKINNHIVYDNPETYLELYPNVDELISFNKLLSVIKKEFNLWTD